MTIVKLQAKKSRGRYVTFMITVPKDYVEALEWKPGDKLVVELSEREGRRGLFIYRLE